MKTILTRRVSKEENCEPTALAAGSAPEMLAFKKPEASAFGSPCHRFMPKLWVAMLAICLICTGSANAEQATLTAKASTDSVQVAEPFSLELQVTADAETEVQFPAIGQQLGDFDVIDQQDLFDIPSASSADQRTWTRRMTLESIVTGELKIPQQKIQIANGASAGTLKSEAIPVRVLSVLEDRADPTRFRDIHSVVDVNVPQSKSSTWIWYSISSLGGLSLAIAAVVAVTRHKRWLTPQQWANRELDSLESSAAMQSGDSETVALELSSILRDYLEMQFEISAPVQTSSELLHTVVAGEYFDVDTAKGFGDLFTLADQAKFAGLGLTKAELTDAIDAARDLTRRTEFIPLPAASQTQSNGNYSVLHKDPM